MDSAYRNALIWFVVCCIGVLVASSGKLPVSLDVGVGIVSVMCAIIGGVVALLKAME